MRAAVRDFEWLNLDRDRAAAGSAQSATLSFTAGPLGQTGGEVFQVVVCTVRGIAEMVARDGVVVGRHLLIVEDIVPERVEAVIEDRLRRIDGSSWTELAEKIGRIAYWEFEDYTPAL